MIRVIKFLIVFCFALMSIQVFAENSVPKMINFQGRVSVAGTPFSGVGQFKFALVNSAGTATFWSNDLSSVNGSEPSSGVAVEVKDGIYSVALGESPMNEIPESVFANNSEVFLRVWFSDNTHGFEMLTPDQRILSVGYALRAAVADKVKDSGRQVITGSLDSREDTGESFDVITGVNQYWDYNQNQYISRYENEYSKYGIKTIPVADLDVNDMPIVKVYYANSANSQQWHDSLGSLFIKESIENIYNENNYMGFLVTNNAIKLFYPKLLNRDNPNSYVYLSYMSGSPSYNVFYKIVIIK